LERKKVYITRRMDNTSIEYLKQYFDVEVNEVDDELGREYFLEKIKDVDGVMCIHTEKIDSVAFDAGKNVKIFANCAVGYDNIDVKEAYKRGIYVTNTPDVLSNATAEIAFSLLICCARSIVDADKFTRDGDFSKWSAKNFLGHDITGKTVGIIGAGRIGKVFSKRCAGFDMKILYHNRKRDIEFESEYGAKFTDLDTLLKKADFISIHVPLSLDTRHIISTREFNLMKNSAVLINTSRGPVVDEKALIAALKDNKIWGAGLDVYENEPDFDKELSKFPNVTLLPHIGSATIETREKMAMLAAQNIKEVLFGNSPITPIKLK
jgi:glyoxylate reductase